MIYKGDAYLHLANERFLILTVKKLNNPLMHHNTAPQHF